MVQLLAEGPGGVHWRRSAPSVTVSTTQTPASGDNMKGVIAAIFAGIVAPLLVWFLTRECGPLNPCHQSLPAVPVATAAPVAPAGDVPVVVPPAVQSHPPRDFLVNKYRDSFRFWYSCIKSASESQCSLTGSLQQRTNDCIQELDKPTCDDLSTKAKNGQ